MTIQQNFGPFNSPDTQLVEQAVSPTIQTAAIGTIGVVCQASRGYVGVPTLVTSITDFARKFGTYNSAHAGEGFMYVYNLFKNGATRLKIVRATDGAETNATLTNATSTYKLSTPGTWGNNVTLTVAANAAAGYVDLTFKNGANESYTYQQVTFTNTADTNYIDTILSNAPEQFVTLTAIGTNPTPGTFTFTGGSDGTLVGTSLIDSSYIGVNGVPGTNGRDGLTGLVSLEGDDEVEIVVCSRANATVDAAVLTHVSLNTVTPRVGICAPASGTLVAGVATLMSTFNSDRLIMTYPWLQILNPYSAKKEYHNPTAFYAGLLSQLSYHISPSRQSVNGVIGTERALTRADVDTLSANRVSPITLYNSSFVVRNGYNTSSLKQLNSITRRRAVNFFARTFDVGSQQFVSRPHTPQLRSDILSSYGSILQGEVALGKIGQVNGGKPYAVKCDSQNNSDADVAAGKCNVAVQISLWAPADFILISLDAANNKLISIQ